MQGFLVREWWFITGRGGREILVGVVIYFLTFIFWYSGDNSRQKFLNSHDSVLLS